MRLVVTGIAFVLVLALLIAVLHPGIALLRRIIGKDRCFGEDALNGIEPWGNAALICALLVYATWPAYGFASLAIVPLMALATMLLCTAWLCLRAIFARKRQFRIRNGAILRREDRSKLSPEYAITFYESAQTGPATEYRVFVILLGRGDVLLATNVYVNQDLAERECSAVMEIAGPAGCRAVDFCFAVRTDPHEWEHVVVHLRWIPILCGPLGELSVEDRDWWRQWCQPRFGTNRRSSIASGVIAEHLDRLVEAYPMADEAPPASKRDRTNIVGLLKSSGDIRKNLRAIRARLARHSTIDIVREPAFWDDVRRQRTGAGLTISTDDDGVRIVSSKPRG